MGGLRAYRQVMVWMKCQGDDLGPNLPAGLPTPITQRLKETSTTQCPQRHAMRRGPGPATAKEQIRADDGRDCPGGPGDAGHAVQSLRLFRIAGQHHDLGLGGTGTEGPDDDSEYRLVAAVPETVIS